MAALGFCSVSEALAQTSQPKINSEKHFPPGLEHNKYKVEAVTSTLTWKLSQAEVIGEREREKKKITSVRGLAELQSTLFSFIYFISVGKVEVS